MWGMPGFTKWCWRHLYRKTQRARPLRSASFCRSRLWQPASSSTVSPSLPPGCAGAPGHIATTFGCRVAAPGDHLLTGLLPDDEHLCPAPSGLLQMQLRDSMQSLQWVCLSTGTAAGLAAHCNAGYSGAHRLCARRLCRGSTCTHQLRPAGQHPLAHCQALTLLAPCRQLLP